MAEPEFTPEMLMELYEYDNNILQQSEGEISQHINQLRGHIEYYRQEIRVQTNQIKEEQAAQEDAEKRLQQQKQLPMLICTVSELFVMEDEETKQKLESVIIKTSSRQNIFCSSPGLVKYSELKPNELIAVHKDSFHIYERLPQFYDARVKQTLVAEKPKDSFADIGGMDQILQQVQEAVILPFQKPQLFEEIGIQPSKGLLLWGAPGVGKTLIARAIAHECDGSNMIQEIFELAKEYVDNDTINGQPQNTPKDQLRGALIYIDEIDAIGTRRHDSDNKEIGRTLMTLLNLMDGFISNNRIKVIASTNRVDQLDPALVRSNRFDRKIECTVPNQSGRVKILEIHSAKMKLASETSLEEVAKACDQFSGAQLKQVCIEAGMKCMRRNGAEIEMRDFMEGVQVVLNRTNKDRVGYL